MYQFILTPEFKEELDDLGKSNVDAAANVILLIETLATDQAMLDELCIPANHYQFHPPFEVKQFATAQRAGMNVYILKFRYEIDGSLPPYRILIGFNSQRSIYYALALAHRSVAYRTDGPEWADLVRRYDECGIPKYR